MGPKGRNTKAKTVALTESQTFSSYMPSFLSAAISQYKAPPKLSPGSAEPGMFGLSPVQSWLSLANKPFADREE